MEGNIQKYTVKVTNTRKFKVQGWVVI